MGMEAPPLRELSEAALARAYAREMEQELKDLEESEWEEWKWSYLWNVEQQVQWWTRRAQVEAAWDEADRLSFDAGHDFTDRRGVRRYMSEESVDDRAVRTFTAMVTNPYSTHVRGFKPRRQY